MKKRKLKKRTTTQKLELNVSQAQKVVGGSPFKATRGNPFNATRGNPFNATRG